MSPSSLSPQTIAEAPATSHFIQELPVLVLMPHSRCNCRCVMCDIWKIRQVREIAPADLESHLASLRKLKVQWVVFSGGEPLLHSDLPALARVLRQEGIRTTLLTAGLTLERHAQQVAENIDDVIVSLDGPREVHDRIRGVSNAYGRLERGICKLRQHWEAIPIDGRCTVQKGNCRHLRAAVAAALDLGLNSISFLAADMSSEAFNHALPLENEKMSEIALDSADVDALLLEFEGLTSDFPPSIFGNFIRETPEKLRRIGMHFRAHLGQTAPVAPRCNAPWVSAVVESDGAVRPCFFHPPIGNLQTAPLVEVLNSPRAVEFRTQLDVSNNPICQRCVCSLFLEAGSPDLKHGDHEAPRGISPPHPSAN